MAMEAVTRAGRRRRSRLQTERRSAAEQGGAEGELAPRLMRRDVGLKFGGLQLGLLGQKLLQTKEKRVYQRGVKIMKRGAYR